MMIILRQPWYDGHMFRPQYRGIYRTRYMGFVGYQYWNGKKWAHFSTTPERAYRQRKEISNHQSPDWQQVRGDQIKCLSE